MPKQAVLRKIERDDGRASKFGISIPQKGSRPKRLFFKTVRERDIQFNRLKRVARHEGHDVLSEVSASDLALLKDLREILGEHDPREAARFFMEQKHPNSKTTIGEALRLFQADQELQNLTETHLHQQNHKLDILALGVGKERRLVEIAPKDITALLRGLGFEPVTQRGYQANWMVFFSWCVANRLCPVSPMAGMKKIKVVRGEVDFMQVADVKAFFGKAVEIHKELAPALALAFFAGMRSASIERMVRDDIDFEHRRIRFQAQRQKTNKRFMVQGYPDNLWDWLEPWRTEKELPHWPGSTFTKYRNQIYSAAKVRFPNNAGRHSFCTHHVALYGSADRTATLLTHRGSVSTLYDHYCGCTTKDEAERYFQIMP
ncbi:hypothetical protein PDESU_05272 [Pontiella desulfatans]|uniref:Tyr recombinase domain-containing protein n=1 Tax=Pontiella desulfatans TaxID=2750659 RepID=A0A6C2UB63_PONDE|nr:hypothetical protein [Pontiella desulfatans]VGO16681.1 hypothetical protein PDESU_05272 [Pontiella desulfatans]